MWTVSCTVWLMYPVDSTCCSRDSEVRWSWYAVYYQYSGCDARFMTSCRHSLMILHRASYLMAIVIATMLCYGQGNASQPDDHCWLLLRGRTLLRVIWFHVISISILFHVFYSCDLCVVLALPCAVWMTQNVQKNHNNKLISDVANSQRNNCILQRLTRK